jgi:hypothetical protein
MKPIHMRREEIFLAHWAVLPMALATLAAVAVVISATSSMIAASPGYSFRVVASLEDDAPGGGEHEGDFEPQDINSNGTVIFVSDLSAGGEGLFRHSRGANSQIVRSGLPAPGTNTTFGLFGILNPGGLNDSGDFAFGFTLAVPFQEFGTNAGVWRYSAATGKVTKVLVPGDPAPGGTTFRGASFHTDLNNRGEIVTTGIIETPYGHCTDPAAPCHLLGRGVYAFDLQNHAAKIAAPGDAAPDSGSVFDDAWDPNINDRGDVVFGGHVTGEPCNGGSTSTIGCFESLYLCRAGTGTLASLVHQGDPTPDGGVFKLAFNGRLNSVGDISFIGGDLLAARLGVFVYTRTGSIVTVAKPGDVLPGGTMVNTTGTQGAHAINGAGDVAFVAQLDSDANEDGIQDTGVYLYQRGTIIPVVRTGTVIPGLGSVAHTNNKFNVGSPFPWPGVHLNDRGEILTQVILTNGQNHVVVATPRQDRGHSTGPPG